MYSPQHTTIHSVHSNIAHKKHSRKALHRLKPFHAERKGLLSLLAANAPGLPTQSVQELPAAPSVPVVVETSRLFRLPRSSSAAVAAVADIGAREIFAHSFGTGQEQLEESL